MTDTRAFCSLLTGVDAEVAESYLGSPEHVAMLEEILAAAPREVGPSVEVFLAYVRDAISPSTPGSADSETFPPAVTNALERITSYRIGTCGAPLPVTTAGLEAEPSTTVPTQVLTTAPVTPASTVPYTVAGVPEVKAAPRSGPVGARIRIEGDGFHDDHWKLVGGPLWLASEDGGCPLYGEAEHTVSVSGDGRLSGELVVPSTGACRMSDLADQPVVPGRYRIVFQCTACSIGTFEVTPAS